VILGKTGKFRKNCGRGDKQAGGSKLLWANPVDCGRIIKKKTCDLTQVLCL
jgi:hypothetical protein